MRSIFLPICLAILMGLGCSAEETPTIDTGDDATVTVDDVGTSDTGLDETDTGHQTDTAEDTGVEDDLDTTVEEPEDTGPEEPEDGGVDEPEEDGEVTCLCDEETDCCDGCQPINLDQPCGQDTECTENLCNQEGLCEETILDGWCYVDETCHDTLTDQDHCGGCDQPCDEGFYCEDGECLQGCPEGWITCNEVCTDILNDPRHCGDCFEPCDPDWHCYEGFCVEPCPEELTFCGGNCVDTTVDDEHCGECNLDCGAEGYCVDSVCAVAVTKITINPASFTLPVEGTQQLEATVTPENATDKRIIWTSQNSSIAVVDETGLVTAVGNGSTQILATAAVGGKSAASDITVHTMVTGVTVNPRNFNMNRHDSLALTAIVQPLQAEVRTVTWSSTAPEVATVSSYGVVDALSSGQAQIIATTDEGGHTGFSNITVTTRVDGITVYPEGVRLVPDQTEQLVATLDPEDADNLDVIWSSSNIQIASVDDHGVVTGHSTGTAQITVRTVDGGKTAIATVRLGIAANGITSAPNDIFMFPEDPGVQIDAFITPHDATDKTILWESDEPDIVDVSDTGLVTCVGIGKANVAAIAADGGFRSITTVQCGYPIESMDIIPTSMAIPTFVSRTIPVIIEPSYATNPTIIWTSEDESIATVETVDGQGVITGVSAGSTIITATTEQGGLADTIAITVVHIPTGWTMVLTGSFNIGSPNNEPSRNPDEAQRRVTLTNSYMIKEVPVTQGEWQTLIGNNPSTNSTCGQHCPVTQVNWYEAAFYCNALSERNNLEPCYLLRDCTGSPGAAYTCASAIINTQNGNPYLCEGYRLPTEAEWEYAARAGTADAFYNGPITNPQGLDDTLDKVAWYSGNAGSLRQVKQKLENQWGLYDMLGNVLEWTSDLYGPYVDSPDVDPYGLSSGPGRVTRGGYYSSAPTDCRIARRYHSTPQTRNAYTSLRPVINIQ